MLPIEIGTSTMERAAVHEASHVVSMWMLGVTVKGVEIAYDDATKEWQGCTLHDSIVDHSVEIEVLLAGGVGESLYVANVYEPVAWQLDPPPTTTALLGPPAGPLALVDITFRNPAGVVKVIPLNRDTFSNDVHRAQDIAQQHGLSISGLLTSTINRVNTPAVWEQILRLAQRFILRPPRILTWRYGPDALIDSAQSRYGLDPLEKSAKKALGL